MTFSGNSQFNNVNVENVGWKKQWFQVCSYKNCRFQEIASLLSADRQTAWWNWLQSEGEICSTKWMSADSYIVN